MSDKKLDLILSEVQRMNSRLDQHEELLTQVVKIVGDNNHMLRKNQDITNTHEYSIDILHREQLKIKADIEMLKNK